MTINELQDKYYFHDSLLDEVIVDRSNSAVSMKIDFCYLAQEGYRDEDPETGIIVLTFSGVTQFPELEGKLDSYSILKTECECDGSWLMILLDDETTTCYESSIKAEIVSLEKGDDDR